MYQIYFTRQALKDRQRLARTHLEPRARALLALLAHDPFQAPPPYEKLLGDLSGAYSRRLNQQHRLVYSVDESKKAVRILRMWTHYE